MRITDLDKSEVAVKALKENFDFRFDTSKLNKAQTKTMLDKVNNLIQEAKSSPDFYKNQTSPSYMKLIFMSQALSEHYLNQKTAKIVLENEEVEKSQVILAAQDMLDSVQKMVEEVNDMLIKELPALTDGIQNEIGVQQAASYDNIVSAALTSLNQALSQSKAEIQNGLNVLTGIGSPEALGALPAGGQEMAVTDIGMDAQADVGDTEIEADEEEIDIEEPNLAGVGREKR